MQETASSFLGVHRIYADSADRSKGTTSDYEFKLPKSIENVVSIELSGFAIPDSLTPSFQTGINDAVDFSVTRVGGSPKFFTFRWPSNSYVYAGTTLQSSFVDTLEKLMKAAMLPDPDLSGVTIYSFNSSVLANGKPNLTALRCDYDLSFSLLFGSGPNREQAANKQLGFERIDYHSSFDPFDPLNYGGEITSPNTVLLDPMRKIQIFVDEIPELSPLAVIYTSNKTYYASKNELASRHRFLDSPPRILSRLTIRVRADGKPIEAGLKNEHSLSFTVYSVVSGSASWFSQYISI